MPPDPMRAPSRYGPIRCPASERAALISSSSAAAGVERNPAARPCDSNIRSTSRHSAGSLPHAAATNGGRPCAGSARTRTPLFAMAARLMRQILVDHARRKDARKGGGAATVLALDESVPAPAIAMVDVLALDEALTELSALDPRLCQVVELKFFAGLN